MTIRGALLAADDPSGGTLNKCQKSVKLSSWRLGHSDTRFELEPPLRGESNVKASVGGVAQDI